MKRFVVVLTVWAMALAGVLASVVFPSAASAATIPTRAGAYASVAPARLADKNLAGVGTLALPVTGVPAGAAAVVLNVSVLAPAKAGFVTVFGGTVRPNTSNINFVAGQNVTSMVVAKLVGGKVNLYNGSGGNIRLVADVTGYYLPGTLSDAGSFGATATPARLMDSRIGFFAPKPAIAGLKGVNLVVAGRGGVPTTASSVLLNVTVTAPTKGGNITVFGQGTTRPNVSNLNFVAGQTVSNLVIAPVSNGMVTLFNNSTGSTALIADVFGFHTGGAAITAGAHGSMVPERLLDTRDGTGIPGNLSAPVAANTSIDLNVQGGGSLVPAGVSAVVLNVTATESKAKGFINVSETGTARANTSNLSFVAGQTVPNLVIAPVDANGRVTLFNGSTGTTHLIADVFGYYRDLDVNAAPGMVTGLTVGTVTQNSIALSWTNPTADFAKVVVRRLEGLNAPASPTDGVDVPVAANAESVTDTTVIAGTVYSYAVFAMDAEGLESEAAELPGIETGADTMAPPMVTGLTATAASTTSIDLVWINPIDADFTGVTIVRKAGAVVPGSISDGIQIAAASATTATDIGLTPSQSGNTYSYAVFAHDAVGNNADAATTSATTTPDTFAPQKVTGLTASAVTAHSITLSWTNPGDTDFAGVMIRRDADGIVPTFTTGVLVKNTASATTATFTDATGLDDGRTYSYALFAYDTSGNYAPVAIWTGDTVTAP